ncbi:LysM peptidoglycan-binding domain-containing protein [Geobacter sp. DSM 9736]|uniref:LysM peptidoglycan-binding domain-containing protein n=1 Tax=Geobacter sp. DSM 9736 TaxID=1277350 RepID=UPI000B500107|nr:LysM domain-containing protein [Geobacter sp. DSM 9736]SNB48114.1 LysM domain-containing protein [Geobacter sp. DSM 9736]
MKSILSALLFVLPALAAGSSYSLAAEEEPSVYVIQKGDTLWGLSDRFLQDPRFWPDLWARNERIGNPHFIFPGQRLRVFPDRVEIEPAQPAVPAPRPVPSPPVPKPHVEDTAPEKTYMVSGGEGFLMENGFRPAGFIVSTYQNRQIVGEDDIVYVDIGKAHGAGVGDRFSIFKRLDPISHPVTNVILGYKVIPLGTLQLSETEEKVSKALITKSYMEIGPGSFLTPHEERRREIPLRQPEHDLAGYIVETRSGNAALAAGDIAYLDLGRNQGLAVGNMLYVVREVVPDQKLVEMPVEKLPLDVVGAVVAVEVGANTSTVLIVKSIDTVYRGDRVEIRKAK